MIFLGIVGAKSPMGKLVLQKIKEHHKEYQICFVVDSRAQRSRKNAVFTDVEDALLTFPPTLVLDFGESKTAYERGKIYQHYHVPAIMEMDGFDEDKIDLLNAVRRASTNSPTLVIEPTFSFNQVLVFEQTLSMLRALAPNVNGVYINFSHEPLKEFNFAPYMLWINKFNQALGLNDFKPQAEERLSFDLIPQYKFKSCRCKFGLVEVELMCYLAKADYCEQDPYDCELAIILQQSKIVTFFRNKDDDTWRGLEMLIDYVAKHKTAQNAEISSILPQLVQQRMS